MNHELGIIIYSYHCATCGNFKLNVDFDVRLKQLCPRCGELAKYKGGTDVRFSSGKVDYVSVEKQSEINRKNIGETAFKQMIKDDPIVKGRTPNNEEKAFWRDGGKPLDLKEIKDTEKYIMTGDKS